MRRYHDVADPRIVKMMAHPLRIKLLRYLEDHVASPTQLAHKFDVVVGTVSYHVRELHKLGLIELVRQVPRRGAIEHFYRAPDHLWFSDETWAELPRVVRSAFSEAALSVVAGEIQAAVSLGHLDTDDSVVSRVTLRLTRTTRPLVNEAVLACIERLHQIEVKAAEELKRGSHSEECSTTVVTFAFESAPEFRALSQGVIPDSTQTAGAAGPAAGKSGSARAREARPQRRTDRKGGGKQ